MKPIVQFVRTTLLGGILFLIPIVTLAIILGKALQLANKVVEPMASHLPETVDIGIARATVLAIGATVLFCFLAGLLARTALARSMVGGLERSVLAKVPAYEYFKQVSESALGIEELGKYPVVLIELGGARQIGVQIEALKDGLLAVFVPDVPNPRSGALYFVSPESVKPAGASLAAALQCLRRFGAGSGELLRNFSNDAQPR